jgi:hypothetical protein
LVVINYQKGEIESVFAPYLGFGVLMTFKLGANVILMTNVAAISPMKDSKVDKNEMVSLNLSR